LTNRSASTGAVVDNSTGGNIIWSCMRGGTGSTVNDANFNHITTDEIRLPGLHSNNNSPAIGDGKFTHTVDRQYDFTASNSAADQKFRFSNSNGSFKLNVEATGAFIADGPAVTVSAGSASIGATHQTTVGAAGAASALPGVPRGYLLINVDGTSCVVPYWIAS